MRVSITAMLGAIHLRRGAIAALRVIKKAAHPVGCTTPNHDAQNTAFWEVWEVKNAVRRNFFS